MGVTIVGQGNAQPADVLTGSNFSSNNGTDQPGSMPNNGSPTLQPGASLAAGYYSGGSAASPGSGSQTFSTPGSFSFTVPSGVTRVTAALAGGGGGAAPLALSSSTSTSTAWGSALPSLSFATNAGSWYTIGLLYAAPSTASPSATASISGTALTQYTSYGTGVGAGETALVLWTYQASASGSVAVSFGGSTTATLYASFSVDGQAAGTPTNTTLTVASGTQTVSGPNLIVINAGGNPTTAITWTNASGLWSELDSDSAVAGAAYATSGTVDYSWAASSASNIVTTVPLVLNSLGGGGGATIFSSLLSVTPASIISGTVGAGGVSAASPTAGGSSTLTVGTVTLTATGGGAASSSPGSGGTVTSGATGQLAASPGSSGTDGAGGASTTLPNTMILGGAGATASTSAGVGGGGYHNYNGGDGQVIINW